MARPRKVILTLQEKIRAIKAAGLHVEQPKSISETETDQLQPLNERIRTILHIVKDKPMKATDVLYLVMYDIENNKVRNLIAKYLLEKGCVRIQKSVYFARTHPKVFAEINETLKEVQEAYENVDSIILVPVHSMAAGNMRIIGKDIQLEAMLNAPNTMFF